MTFDHLRHKLIQIDIKTQRDRDGKKQTLLKATEYRKKLSPCYEGARHIEERESEEEEEFDDKSTLVGLFEVEIFFYYA